MNSGTVCKFWLCKYLNTAQISNMGFVSEYLVFTGFDSHLSFLSCGSIFFVKFPPLLSHVVWSLSTHCNSIFSENFSFFRMQSINCSWPYISTKLRGDKHFIIL